MGWQPSRRGDSTEKCRLETSGPMEASEIRRDGVCGASGEGGREAERSEAAGKTRRKSEAAIARPNFACWNRAHREATLDAMARTAAPPR